MGSSQSSSFNSSSFNSKENGSLSSISEPFAFPYEHANKNHESTTMSHYKGTYFSRINNGYKKTIVFCHGNCMTVQNSLIKLFDYYSKKLEVDFYLVEYPGYGEANIYNTRPTANTCVEALSNVIECMTNVYNLKYEDIFLMGYSIGTGVVSQYVYRNRDIKFLGMILLSPYKSILSVVFDNGLIEASSTSFNFFKIHDIIYDIKIPILILHGKDDQVIDVSHSEALKKQNSTITLFILNNIGHNDILESNETLEKLKDWIKK